MSSGGERSTGARQDMLPATCRHDTAAARLFMNETPKTESATLPMRQATTLVVGQYYRHLGNRFGMIMSPRPLKYCGTCEHNGRTNHQFWDDGTRLLHWIEPDQIGEV